MMTIAQIKELVQKRKEERKNLLFTAACNQIQERLGEGYARETDRIVNNLEESIVMKFCVPSSLFFKKYAEEFGGDPTELTRAVVREWVNYILPKDADAMVTRTAEFFHLEITPEGE